MLRTPSSSRASIAIVVAFALCEPGRLLAQDAATQANLDQARQRYERANVHYELGEYQQAIALYREAYEIYREPVLLFNLGQAYRLGGQCERALDAYRHFLRLSTAASEQAQRLKAEVQSEALRPTCGRPAFVPVAPAPAQMPAPPAEPGSPEAIAPPASLWLLGGALLAGASAGGLYLWNTGRYREWRTENDAIQRGGSAVPVAEWQRRQQVNDNLDKRIDDVDTVAVAAAITAGVLAVAAAVWVGVSAWRRGTGGTAQAAPPAIGTW